MLRYGVGLANESGVGSQRGNNTKNRNGEYDMEPNWRTNSGETVMSRKKRRRTRRRNVRSYSLWTGVTRPSKFQMPRTRVLFNSQRSE